MENEKIIIDIQANCDEALASIVELKAAEEELRKKQKELDTATDEGKKQFVAYSEAIKANKKAQSEQSAALQNAMKNMKSAEGSMSQMKAQLSALTKQYNELSKSEREGDVGKALGEQISNLTAELSRNEEALGNYRRNVGNYKSAVEGLLPIQNTMLGKIIHISQNLPTLGAAMKGVGAASKALGKQLLALAANPFIAIAGVIALLVMKIVDAFKRSESATMALKKAFAALNPIIDIVNRAFDALAKGVTFVVDAIADFIGSVSDASKEAMKLQDAENKLVLNQRKLNEEAAKSEMEVAELRAKVAEKDKYTKEQRMAFLDEAIKKEEAIAKKKKALAEEELRVAEEQAKRSENDAAANERLSSARIAVYNADKELSAKTRELNAQRAELVNSIKAEDEAAKKAAAEKRMKAEAEAAKKLAEAQKKYADSTKELVEKFKSVKELIVKNEQEQVEAIRKKYDDAILAANDYTAEIEALQSKSKLNDGEKKRLQELQSLQFESAEIQYRLEQQKQAEITAIDNTAAKERIDAAIEAIDNAHAIELAKAKNNSKETADIERKALEEKAAAYEQLINDEKLSDADRLQAQVDYYTTLAELEARDLETHKAAEDAKTAATKAAVQARIEKIGKIQEYSNQALSAISQIADIVKEKENAELEEYETANDEKKEALKQRLDDGLISQDEYNQQVAAMDEELKKKQAELELKQAKRQKAMAIMNATLSAAQAIIASLAQSPVAIGPIPNPAGIASLALATVTGAAQIAAIAAQPLPKASRGALLQGASHAEGGIPIEAEGGEAIINKKSTARFRPLLSAINEWGGGVKFARGGIPLDGGYSTRAIEQVTNAVTRQDLQQVANTPIYTTITDIRREDRRYTEIKDLRNV